MRQPFATVPELMGFLIELVGELLLDWILRRKRERK
jgi:hypothetical protein